MGFEITKYSHLFPELRDDTHLLDSNPIDGCFFFFPDKEKVLRVAKY